MKTKEYEAASANAKILRAFGDAVGIDAPRGAIRAANAMGGPKQAPQLIVDACFHGAFRCVQTLLAKGWDPQAADEHGNSALALATAAHGPGAEKIADLLMGLGCDPREMGSRGSAIGAAARSGKLALMKRMIAAPSDRALLGALNHALAWACEVNQPSQAACCVALVEAGARWDSQPKILAPRHANCAQLAAQWGSIEAFSQSPGFVVALTTRHPPLKGRAAWTDWRSLGLDSERSSLVERAILMATAADPSLELESESPAGEAPKRRVLRM